MSNPQIITNVLRENVRLCERMIDGQDREIEALNRRLVLIVALSLSLAAYIYSFSHKDLLDLATKTTDSGLSEIINMMAGYVVYAELLLYGNFALIICTCAFGLWPLSLDRLPVEFENYTVHKDIDSYQMQTIKFYTEIFLANERKLNFRKSFPLNSVLFIVF